MVALLALGVPWLLAVFGIGWLVFNWRDPNYRAIGADDNLMRVRNALMILSLAAALPVLSRIYALAVGWLPTAVVRAGTSGTVQVAIAGWAPWARDRLRSTALPVTISQVHVAPGRRQANVRWLSLRGGGGAVNIGTMWRLNPQDIAELEHYLSGVIESS